MDEKKEKKPLIKINLADIDLFGNDAADLEQENLFISYAIDRSELNDFLNLDYSIQISRAFKGEGKSSLLRIVRHKLSIIPGDQLVISAIGPDHSPVLDNLDSDLWTREWKKSILKLVANEIGSKLGLAFTDDAISLVEEAESNGFKQRSFVSAITDRLKTKALEIERTRPQVQDYQKLVSRYLNGRPLIWIIIDDIDQNFSNTEKWRIKLGAFFTACRQIVGVIPELRIRTAIRPNVWAIIKREFESLSHLEQYIHDLSWSQDDFRKLLASRVKAYLIRTKQWSYILPTLPKEDFLQELKLVAMIFDENMPWGGGTRTRPPHVVLWTLTSHRPRWLIELCKEAAKATVKRRSDKIYLEDIFAQLSVFGQKRIEDTVAEFRSQCPQIDDLLGAFSRQQDIYTTDELLSLINNRIIQSVRPTIVGIVGSASNLDIAHFLFQIGFISGRRDYGDHRGYDHIMFRENPSLLKSKTNLDDGLRWEVNPIFRDVLNLRITVNKSHLKDGNR